MFTKSNGIILVAAVLAGASTALAKDRGLPKLNVESACRASQTATAAATGVTSDDLGTCISDENDARKQLEKDWATYPASDKAVCIQPKEYTPGYIEWLTCLEMN